MKRRDFKEVEKSLGFDSQKEVEKYNYLCTRKAKKLKKEEQFTSFHSWRDHIVAKYNNCKVEQLEELSRFLKLGERNHKDSIAICSTLFPVIISIGLATLIDIYSKNAMSNAQGWESIIIAFVTLIAMLIGILIILCTCIKIIGKEQDYRNMYHDYDEVIKDLIEKNS